MEIPSQWVVYNKESGPPIEGNVIQGLGLRPGPSLSLLVKQAKSSPEFLM